jgi:hypothetical protein
MLLEKSNLDFYIWGCKIWTQCEHLIKKMDHEHLWSWQFHKTKKLQIPMHTCKHYQILSKEFPKGFVYHPRYRTLFVCMSYLLKLTTSSQNSFDCQNNIKCTTTNLICNLQFYKSTKFLPPLCETLNPKNVINNYYLVLHHHVLAISTKRWEM